MSSFKSRKREKENSFRGKGKMLMSAYMFECIEGGTTSNLIMKHAI